MQSDKTKTFFKHLNQQIVVDITKLTILPIVLKRSKNFALV